MPPLWKVRSDCYKNKQFKEDFYKQLTKLLKESEPDASFTDTKRKINSLRSTYRLELKKVEASKKLGDALMDVYTPILWYFNDLEFFCDQEEQVSGVLTISDGCEDNTN
ncbi:hypothetical protein PR048_032666 [Dryococelus australis]|uniref:MADF domain-containing protein n=1 Tax=Dryococelus australis TaxID=614101 RepID=A0ABQ9G2U2_9NEOP|nr:hypothetical protein PR048_032666 [Dryococelus australis]